MEMDVDALFGAYVQKKVDAAMERYTSPASISNSEPPAPGIETPADEEDPWARIRSTNIKSGYRGCTERPDGTWYLQPYFRGHKSLALGTFPDKDSVRAACLGMHLAYDDGRLADWVAENYPESPAAKKLGIAPPKVRANPHGEELPPGVRYDYHTGMHEAQNTVGDERIRSCHHKADVAISVREHGERVKAACRRYYLGR